MRAKEDGGRNEKTKAKREKKEKVKLNMAADYQKVNQKAKVRVKNYPTPEKRQQLLCQLQNYHAQH